MTDRSARHWVVPFGRILDHRRLVTWTRRAQFRFGSIGRSCRDRSARRWQACGDDTRGRGRYCEGNGSHAQKAQSAFPPSARPLGQSARVMRRPFREDVRNRCFRSFRRELRKTLVPEARRTAPRSPVRHRDDGSDPPAPSVALEPWAATKLYFRAEQSDGPAGLIPSCLSRKPGDRSV